MLRKILIALAATAAVGLAVGTADAKGGHPGGMSGSSGSSGSTGSMKGPSGPSSFSKGPSQMGTVSPSTSGTLNPRTSNTWSGNNWGGRHHHRHDRFFFGAGFAGPYYDYGYDSCWRIVPTYYGGWRRVWVCDYPYWGY